MHGKSHKKDMKSKWKKYKEGAKTENIGKRTHNTVMGVEDLAGKIFDEMGGKPEHLKGAFGRPIDTTGKKVKYGGIGEVGHHG